MGISYFSITDDYADKIRQSLVDDFGNKVEINIAGETGYGPCRCCLRQFKPGETRLLFAYAPVGGNSPYNETGPVFIHKTCSSYKNRNQFPEEVRNGRMPISLVLRCYDNKRRLIAARFVKNNDSIENEIEALFTNEDIDSIHIRNATYQCYIAEIRRFQGTGS